MHHVSINRPTREEIETNTKLLNTFVNLFKMKNYGELIELMHPKGRFFNIPYPATAEGYLFQILCTQKGLSGTYFCMHVNYGFTMDEKPGEDVVEFRFMDFDPFTMHPQNDPNKNLSKALGEPGDDDLKELIYRFSLTFKDGKIYTLRHPKRFTADLEYFNLSNWTTYENPLCEPQKNPAFTPLFRCGLWADQWAFNRYANMEIFGHRTHPNHWMETYGTWTEKTRIIALIT